MFACCVVICLVAFVHLSPAAKHRSALLPGLICVLPLGVCMHHRYIIWDSIQGFSRPLYTNRMLQQSTMHSQLVTALCTASVDRSRLQLCRHMLKASSISLAGWLHFALGKLAKQGVCCLHSHSSRHSACSCNATEGAAQMPTPATLQQQLKANAWTSKGTTTAASDSYSKHCMCHLGLPPANTADVRSSTSNATELIP